MLRVRTDIPGFMTVRELYQLADWVSLHTKPHSTIVECGSLAGRSSFVLAANCASNSTLYCYDRFNARTTRPFGMNKQQGDPWDNTGRIRVGEVVNFLDLFQENLSEFSHVHTVVCDLPGSVDLPKSIDFFFFDLLHTNPTDRRVLEQFLPCFHSQTFICGHDYLPDRWPDVVENCHWLSELLDRPLVRAAHSLWALTPAK